MTEVHQAKWSLEAAKELSENRATEIINLIDSTTRDIGRTHEEETVLSLGMYEVTT